MTKIGQGYSGMHKQTTDNRQLNSNQPVLNHHSPCDPVMQTLLPFIKKAHQIT